MNNEIKQNVLRGLELNADDICTFLRKVIYGSDDDAKIIDCLIDENIPYDAHDPNAILNDFFDILSEKSTKAIKDWINHEKQKEETEKQEDEEEEEVFYKEGDKFKHPNGVYQLQKLDYRIAGTAQMALVKISAKAASFLRVGYIWLTRNENRRVQDAAKITKEEFAKITDNQTNKFELIKE